MKFVILIAFSVFFLISNLNAEEYSIHIIEKCSQWKKERCSDSCPEGERGKFAECYMDPEYSGKMRWRDCYAIHAGYSCRPCQDFFATNFGGSFKKNTCEYFYAALEKKNKNCGNCLQMITHIQLDPSELLNPESK